MNYQKINLNNCNLHIIQTDLYKTVSFKLNFKRKLKKDEITIRNFASDILFLSSNKYKTRREIEIETENLYNLWASSNTYKSGKYHIISFSAVFLNEKYTEKGMHEKSIEFLSEIIFNPNIIKNKFTSDSFNIVKREIKEGIESIIENPARYSKIRMLSNMDPDSIISIPSTGNLEDLEKISERDLVDYYNSFIDNDMVDIFIIGNFDVEEIKEAILKNIKLKDRKYIKENHMIDDIKKSIKEKIVKEKFDVNQSKLSIGLNVDTLTDFEAQYVMRIFSFILGGGSDSKLFKIVREKHSLCYYISSSYLMDYNSFQIVSGIDSKNFDEVIKLIKEQLKEMQEGNFLETSIEDAKTTYRISIEDLIDNPNAIINSYLGTEYFNSDLLEDKIKNIDKVTKKMIVDVANKVSINTIFLLEGGLDGKESIE